MHTCAISIECLAPQACHDTACGARQIMFEPISLKYEYRGHLVGTASNACSAHTFHHTSNIADSIYVF